MSHPENDKSNDAFNDIVFNHLEAITKLNPEQIKVYNAVTETLFANYFNKNKQEEK